MYDQYGRDGLNGSAPNGNSAGYHRHRHHRHRHHHDFDGHDDFDAVFGFPNFVFRDPEEVFREFFGGRDPFEDLFDPFGLLGGGRQRSARTRHSPYHHPAHAHHGSTAVAHPFRSPFADFGMSPFGLLGGFPMAGFGGGHRGMFGELDDFDTGLGGNSFTSVQTFSNAMGGGMPGGPGGMSMRSSSTSTRFVNGKKITTKRYKIL